MKKTKKLTLVALLAALSTILLVLGRFIEVLDLSMAALATLLVLLVFIELGGGWAVALWLSTSALSLLLAPSGAPLLYAAIGFYPIAKAAFERKPRAIERTLKLGVCLLALALYVLVAKFVLMLPDAMLDGILLWGFLALAVLVFLLYDYMLTRLAIYYQLRLRHRFARLFK